jgi:hypothetical protein
MQECRVIEEIDPERQVMYISYNLPIVDKRDGCVFSVKKLEPGKGMLSSTSIEHPLCPRVASYVRVSVNISLTIFEEIQTAGACHTKLISLIHADPKGLIPAFFVNKMLSSAVDQVADMNDFIAKSHRENQTQ